MATAKKARKGPNKVKKGKDYQDWAAGLLKEWGWFVHNQKPVARQIPIKGKKVWVSQRNDLWGLFDIAAMKKGHRNLLIQTTLDSHVEKREEQLREGPDIDLNHNAVEVWLKRKPGRTTVFRWDGSSLSVYGEIWNRRLMVENTERQVSVL